MKKIISLTAVLLFITGCSQNSNYQTKVDNGSNVVVSGENISITHQDIYEYLMDGYGANYVVNEALQTIAENYELDEALLQSELETSINTYKTFMGEDLDKFTKENLGYESFDEYVEKVMKPSVRQKLMTKDYITTNFDTLAKQYHFKKIRMIVMDTEQSAMETISKISSGEMTFEEALELSTDEKSKENKGELGVVSDLTTSSNVDKAIISILPQFDVNALYSVPVKISKGYAVLDIMETDVNAMKDDILKVLYNSEKIAAEANAYYLAENGFKVYEKRLEESIKLINPDYIK